VILVSRPRMRPIKYVNSIPNLWLQAQAGDRLFLGTQRPLPALTKHVRC